MRRLRAILAAVLAASAVSVSPVLSPPASGPTEDSAGWDCRIHGNRVCGVGNAQGVPAGDYSTLAGR